MKKLLLILSLLVLSAPAPVPPVEIGQGVGTLSVVPAPNNVRANWQNAGMQSVGGIPNRTTICATLSPIGGGASDETALQNAINSCTAGQVLQLSDGTFTLDNNTFLALNKGITIRGCTVVGNCNASRLKDDCNASSGTAQNATIGPGANLTGSPYCPTVLSVKNGAQIGLNGCGSGCIINAAIKAGTGGGLGDWTTSTNLTADAAQGAATITVASAAGLSVGQWVLINEGNNPSFVADPSTGTGYAAGGTVYASPDWSSSSSTAVVNGVASATNRLAWQLHNPGITGDDCANVSACGSNSQGVFCFFSLCNTTDGFAVQEIHKITAINGNTITFDDPLTIAFQTALAARLTAADQGFVTNAGVENLSIVGSTNGAVHFTFCALCWAKGVESSIWLNGGFVIDNSVRVELNRVFVHHSAFPFPGGAEYGVDMLMGATEIYIVDSINILTGKAMTERCAGAGSVVAYNYVDMAMSSPPTFQEMGANGSHTAGSHMTLLEGNWTQNLDDDVTHGSEFYHTKFRNLSTAIRTPFLYYIGGESESGHTITDANSNNAGLGKCNGVGGGCGPLRAAGEQEYNYWHAYIGNVLGVSGVTVAANAFQLNANFTNNGGTQNPGIWMLGWFDVVPQPLDTTVATRTFQHGNYNYFNNSIQWDSGTANHDLPNSLYLSAAPAFFSAGSGNVWPWVTPDQTPQFHTLPAKARFDAGTPFVQP